MNWFFSKNETSKEPTVDDLLKNSEKERLNPEFYRKLKKFVPSGSEQILDIMLNNMIEFLKTTTPSQLKFAVIDLLDEIVNNIPQNPNETEQKICNKIIQHPKFLNIFIQNIQNNIQEFIDFFNILYSKVPLTFQDKIGCSSSFIEQISQAIIQSKNDHLIDFLINLLKDKPKFIPNVIAGINRILKDVPPKLAVYISNQDDSFKNRYASLLANTLSEPAGQVFSTSTIQQIFLTWPSIVNRIQMPDFILSPTIYSENDALYNDCKWIHQFALASSTDASSEQMAQKCQQQLMESKQLTLQWYYLYAASFMKVTFNDKMYRRLVEITRENNEFLAAGAVQVLCKQFSLVIRKETESRLKQDDYSLVEFLRKIPPKLIYILAANSVDTEYSFEFRLLCKFCLRIYAEISQCTANLLQCQPGLSYKTYELRDIENAQWCFKGFLNGLDEELKLIPLKSYDIDTVFEMLGTFATTTGIVESKDQDLGHSKKSEDSNENQN